MKTSEQINQIAAALAKAQAEMENPILDRYNPHFRSRFAGLAGVRNAVVPALARNGISVTQEPINTERGVSIVTTLWHTSGQFFAFEPFEIPAAKVDAQGLGSASTYAKRYALQAVACVAGDLDDDGAAATGGGGDDVQLVTPEQVEQLDKLIEEVGADKEKFLHYINAASLDEIHAGAFETCVREIKSKRRAKK